MGYILKNILSIFLLFVLASVLLPYLHDDIKNNTIFVYLACISLFILIVRFVRFDAGQDGEWDVEDELKKLPSEFKCIYDLPSSGGNVDFVVVGPSGVFAIEAKNIERGLISNYFFYKKFLKQSRKEALFINKLLSNSLGIGGYVEPALVSAHKKVDVRFGFEPQEGVYVINIKWLQKFFEEYQPARTMDRKTIDKIFDFLTDYKNKN